MKTTAVRKPDIRVKKTYDKLYSAFFELLTSQPFENISVLDLCEKAEVHRATFYKHFLDKQDFVSFCCTRLLENLNLANEMQIIGEGDESKALYVNMCKKVIRFVHDNRSFIKEITSSPGAETFNDTLLRSFADLFEKRLTKVVSGGGVLGSPIPMLANYYAGGIVSLLKWWAIDGEKYTEDDVLRFAVTRLNEAEISFLHNKCMKDYQENK